METVHPNSDHEHFLAEKFIKMWIAWIWGGWEKLFNVRTKSKVEVFCSWKVFLNLSKLVRFVICWLFNYGFVLPGFGLRWWIF